MLRLLARQTWRYFDDFVGPQSNWLPPDNYQDALRVEVARRTSPTNIGLWLLSSLTANDCGYVTLDDLVERGLGTLETLHKLERFEGHILNWYDTGTLEPLSPRYVSTVDSGNLLASLWGAVQGYHDVLERPLIGPQALTGVADTLGLLRESMKSELGAGVASRAHRRPRGNIGVTLCLIRPRNLSDVIQRMRAAAEPARELAEAIRASAGDTTASISATGAQRCSDRLAVPQNVRPTYWSRQLERQVGCWLDVVDRYLPWVESLARQPDEVVLALGDGRVRTGDGKLLRWRPRCAPLRLASGFP